MNKLGLAVASITALLTVEPVIAQATAPIAHGFDPEAATQAYLSTLSGAARERSDAYFDGGYWLLLWGFLVGTAVNLAFLSFGCRASCRHGRTERAADAPSSARCSGPFPSSWVRRHSPSRGRSIPASSGSISTASPLRRSPPGWAIS